jgi:hypothetical protein
MYICIYYLTNQFKTMKTEFNKVIDFLETQQQEDKLNTNQLHLIIQTLCTFLDDEQLKEVENLFNLKK